jgi:peptide/nickel transport system permease protein
VIAALNYGRTLDRVISIAGLSFVALPEFVVGGVVIVIFAVKLGWFPTSSQVPERQPGRHRAPVPAAVDPAHVRALRVHLADGPRGDDRGAALELHATAVLKGLPRRYIILRHVLRNSLLPTITVVSVQVGYLVGGLVVVETLFNYPGSASSS